MGWDKKRNVLKIKLDEKIPTKYLNYSAKKIKYKKNFHTIKNI